MSKGYFITFEGGEGAGKSTQIKLLADNLKKNGRDVVITREPGGTPAAEEIRNLLSHKDFGGNWTQDAELLLFFAARSMHIRDIIAPALSKGKIVLSDRYIDSTRVYQGIMHKIDMNFIMDPEAKIVREYVPDLTFLIDIPVEIVLNRVKGRGVGDHYDEQDKESHQILRDGFLKLANKEPNRFEVIHGNNDIQTIAHEISQIAQERLFNVV